MSEEQDGRRVGEERRGRELVCAWRGRLLRDTGGWLWTVYYFPIKGAEFMHRSSRFGTTVRDSPSEKWEQSTDWKYGWSSSTHSGCNSSCNPHMWGLENTAKRKKTLHNSNNSFIDVHRPLKRACHGVINEHLPWDLSCKLQIIVFWTNKICHYYRIHISLTVLYINA